MLFWALRRWEILENYFQIQMRNGSMKLLAAVADLLGEKGYSVVNIDATVLAQAPKLVSHISQMRENIAHACGILPDQVSVKATTEEGLGFTGSGQGIAAHAVCLLQEN